LRIGIKMASKKSTKLPAATATESIGTEPLPEVAFYYPGHLWHSSDWIKTLLLFFDGVGLLVPEYKKREPELMDPTLAGPLRDKGLLHYFIADKAVDKDATEKLVQAVDNLISSGALDSLVGVNTTFHEISMSRMGFYGDEKLASRLFAALEKRGLAKKSEDGISIPLHPLVRYLILTLLAQILRPQGLASGLDLSPATDQFRVVQALTEFLNLPQLPSAGHVVAFDLQSVSVDLGAIPLDEVLAFRTEHGKEHRKYVRSARAFARELSLMPLHDRTRAFADRQTELDDLASELRKNSRKAWRKPASFCLGLAGGCWSLAGGNLVGGLLSLGGLFARGFDKSSNEAGAYSYLFAAHRQFA
jgi:hypothetical protein